MRAVNVTYPKPHKKQLEITHSTAKYKCVRAGRRGGKTVFACREAVKRMFGGFQVFIASPSQKQVDSFWRYAKRWLHDAIQAGAILKNEQSRILSFSNPHKRGRIECRTARFPDDLRGGFGDFIVLDEAAFLDESALDEVIFPMLWDTDGDLWLLSTPKAGTWFNELCRKIQAGEKREFEEFYFTSLDNPHIRREAVLRAKEEMSERAWQEEGLALLLDEVKGALWRRAWIRRKNFKAEDCERIVVAVDPAVSATAKSAETGIVVCGRVNKNCAVVLEDASGKYTPAEWAQKAIQMYEKYRADRIVAEKNNGGDLVAANLKSFAGEAARSITIKLAHASRGKYARAEPVAALYQPKEGEEEGKVFHAGEFEKLENQMVTWTLEADYSPDRVDALVWGITELMVKQTGGLVVF